MIKFGNKKSNKQNRISTIIEDLYKTLDNFL